MKLRDDDMSLSHILDIHDMNEEDFLKRLEDNDYYYDETNRQIKAK